MQSISKWTVTNKNTRWGGDRTGQFLVVGCFRWSYLNWEGVALSVCFGQQVKRGTDRRNDHLRDCEDSELDSKYFKWLCDDRELKFHCDKEAELVNCAVCSLPMICKKKPSTSKKKKIYEEQNSYYCTCYITVIQRNWTFEIVRFQFRLVVKCVSV